MDDNVVLFPKGKKNTPPQTLEEIRHNAEEVAKEHIEYLLEDLVGMVIGASYDAGFDLSDPKAIRSTILITEAIKAGLYRAKGIEHPLHMFSDNVDVANIRFTEMVTIGNDEQEENDNDPS